jgi:hypothetical protein
MPLQDESYECLEFEGDSVLGVCIATYLRKRYPEKKQGFLTDARKELVNNERLGELSKSMGLNRFYVISRHNEDSIAIDGRNNAKKLGDIFEAFLGALWTDCGNRFAIVYAFVTTVMETYLDIDELVNSATNFKDVFQKYCQREFRCTPGYEMRSKRPQEESNGGPCLWKARYMELAWEALERRRNRWPVERHLVSRGGRLRLVPPLGSSSFRHAALISSIFLSAAGAAAGAAAAGAERSRCRCRCRKLPLPEPELEPVPPPPT